MTCAVDWPWLPRPWLRRVSPRRPPTPSPRLSITPSPRLCAPKLLQAVARLDLPQHASHVARGGQDPGALLAEEATAREVARVRRCAGEGRTERATRSVSKPAASTASACRRRPQHPIAPRERSRSRTSGGGGGSCSSRSHGAAAAAMAPAQSPQPPQPRRSHRRSHRRRHGRRRQRRSRRLLSHHFLPSSRPTLMGCSLESRL